MKKSSPDHLSARFPAIAFSAATADSRKRVKYHLLFARPLLHNILGPVPATTADIRLPADDGSYTRATSAQRQPRHGDQRRTIRYISPPAMAVYESEG